MERTKIQTYIRLPLQVVAMLGLLVIGCDMFREEQRKIPIASVSDSYLFFEDIKDILPENVHGADSTAIVEAYINRWAVEQLLLGQAKVNLPNSTQERFEKMVKEYERNLFTEAYKNTYVSKQLDSVVNEEDIRQYYELNKENFHLNNELLKIRYISLNKEYSDVKEVIDHLKQFNEEDKEELTRKSYQFKQINLNDSVWVKKDVLLAELPILKESSDELNKTRFIELQDSIGVYLLKVEDRLERNDIAPLEYIRPTIKQILLNAKKLELVKRLEKDIIEDAVKNKKFQVYAP